MANYEEQVAAVIRVIYEGSGDIAKAISDLERYGLVPDFAPARTALRNVTCRPARGGGPESPSTGRRIAFRAHRTYAGRIRHERPHPLAR